MSQSTGPTTTGTCHRIHDQNALRVITPYSRIPRYEPSPASGNTPAYITHAETSVQHPQPIYKAPAANLAFPSEPQTMSSPLSTSRVPSPFQRSQIPRVPETGIGRRMATDKVRAISGPAPRQNRTALLRAQNVKGEQIGIDLRRRNKTEPVTGKAKERTNGNLDPQAVRRKVTGFENEDPFLDGPGERSPIPPRFAKALATQKDAFALYNPKIRQPQPPMAALPQPLNQISVASSLISAPGNHPSGFKIDQQIAPPSQRSVAGGSNTSFSTISSTASCEVAETAQVLAGEGTLPVAISGDRLLTLGKRPLKARPISFAGSPAKPSAPPHRRSISADHNFGSLRKDQKERSILPSVKEGVDTSEEIIETATERPSTAEISFTQKEQAALTQIQQQQNSNVQNWAGTLPQATDIHTNSAKGEGVGTPGDISAHPDGRGQQKLQKPVGFEPKLKRASYPRGTASSATKQVSNTSARPMPTTGTIRQRPTNGAVSAIPKKTTGHVRTGARVIKRTTTPDGTPMISPRSQRTGLPIARPAILGNKSVNVKSPVQRTPPIKKGTSAPGRETSSGFSGPIRKENQGAKGKLSTAIPSNKPEPGPKCSDPKLNRGGAVPIHSPGSKIPRLSPKPLADISSIGGSKNPRLGTNRKWLGLKKPPKVDLTTPSTHYEKIPPLNTAVGKENVAPTSHQTSVSDEQGTKSKLRLGVMNWFRDSRASRQSRDSRTSTQSRLSGKGFPKFGKPSGGKESSRNIPEIFLPEFDITQEQVDTLKNRLSANYLSPQNTVGGQYFSKKVPTIDASPTRDEKDGNPIKVCMELINSASAEQNPEVRENLFKMSRILVDAVTRSKDAQCASEKARVASNEAKMATAEVFVKLQSVVEILKEWKQTGRLLDFSAK